MKRLIPILLVVLIALTIATPVAAAGLGSRHPYALVGKITAIDPVAKTVTVQVLRGNWVVKPYLKQEITLKTTATTRFFFTDGVTSKLIKFEDLKVGNPISSSGNFANAVWTATRITVGAKLSCLI